MGRYLLVAKKQWIRLSQDRPQYNMLVMMMMNSYHSFIYNSVPNLAWNVQSRSRLLHTHNKAPCIQYCLPYLRFQDATLLASKYPVTVHSGSKRSFSKEVLSVLTGYPRLFSPTLSTSCLQLKAKPGMLLLISIGTSSRFPTQMALNLLRIP